MFLCCPSEQIVEQTLDWPVINDAMMVIRRRRNEKFPWVHHELQYDQNKIKNRQAMMTSSNGNIFRVTGHLCGEFTGDRTKAGDAAALWCFALICVWINGWVNNREAGDLRHYRAHYDVTVMYVYESWDKLLQFAVNINNLNQWWQSGDSLPKWIRYPFSE